MFWLAQKSPSIVNNQIGVTDGQLKACGVKPNCVSSAAEADSKFYIEPLLSENVEGLWDDLNILVTDLTKSGRYEVRSAQENYIHIIAISKIFGFVDDVEFLLLPDQRMIQMRSQSRVGYSDMGANRKRLEKIRSLLQPQP